MKVMVVNCGSSSLKFKLFDMTDEDVLASGAVDRIGPQASVLAGQALRYRQVKRKVKATDHLEAFKIAMGFMKEAKVLANGEVQAVGHRVVHGGDKYSSSVIIDKTVLKDIERFSGFAPLHNPANLSGIRAAMKLMPKVPHVAVFDTAFHHTIPEFAYLYGLPYNVSKKHGIRKYGFHGSSHAYVAQRTAIILGRPLRSLKIITCHIGSGTSICAVKRGRSLDTSMGMTPLQGVIMGTRTGSLDPSIVDFLEKREKLSQKQAMELFNKKSGLLGISGVSNDVRDIEKAAAKGNRRAELALALHAYQIKKFIGSYIMAMSGVDAITFTAGVGENSPRVRADVCSHLEFLDTYVDDDRNRKARGECIISARDSKVAILVIPTDEELYIARETIK